MWVAVLMSALFFVFEGRVSVIHIYVFELLQNSTNIIKMVPGSGATVGMIDCGRHLGPHQSLKGVTKSDFLATVQHEIRKNDFQEGVWKNIFDATMGSLEMQKLAFRLIRVAK